MSHIVASSPGDPLVSAKADILSYSWSPSPARCMPADAGVDETAGRSRRPVTRAARAR